MRSRREKVVATEIQGDVMKSLESVWGEVRSALHEPGLEVMERARRLDRALPGVDAEAMRDYILDHEPRLSPKSPELSYELARAWMFGELPYLLNVLSGDLELVELLQEKQSVLQGAVEQMDRVLGSGDGYMDFAPVGLAGAASVEQCLEARGELEQVWLPYEEGGWIDLEHEVWQAHKHRIFEGIWSFEYEDTNRVVLSFNLDVPDESNQTYDVQMSLTTSGYQLEFLLWEVVDETPEAFAMMWLGGILRRCDPNFDFVFDEHFLKRDEEFEQTCALYREKWLLYKRLCL